MDLSPLQCWDCPEPISHVLPPLLIGLVVAAVGAYLFSKSNIFLRNLGRVLLVVCAFWYIFVSLGLWRYGVVWSGDGLHVNRIADAALLLAWYLVTLFTLAKIRPSKHLAHRPAG